RPRGPRVLLGVAKQFAAQPAALPAGQHCDPPQRPGAVGHGLGSVVGEPEYAALVFQGDAAMASSSVGGVIVIEDFAEGLNLQLLDPARLLGKGYQYRRVVGDGRSDHGVSFSPKRKRGIAEPAELILRECGSKSATVLPQQPAPPL